MNQTANKGSELTLAVGIKRLGNGFIIRVIYGA